ncbi:hypothetical protein PILCRDRAFT_93742 [Piloderma croceum F 1598]|uniref:Uncharacterized protein n=1 Tax=Piloderma croceum (strain F 1598) TaxID=765440 RepID=A0A0C3EGE1_PILCF|nr:hypothetical protein PILCRDRAFT_93742 [Piloderma croceum F 1598]
MHDFSPPPPLTPDDFVRLNQWEGGCLFSVHDSNLADDWVNRFYDHECLVNLRANEIGGPIPSMLSVNAPALTIFGSMSPKMMELADELAKLSGFPVTIRPVTEDPSAHFKCYQSSHLSGEPSGSQTKGKTDVIAKRECGSSTSTQRKKWLPGRDDHQDEQPEDEDDDDGRRPPDPPIPEADPHHREITHDTDIRLKILVDGKDKGDFIKLETSVKCYPIPNVKNLLDGDKSTGRTSKPNIEAHIVRLKMLGSPSVQIDSATGSVGFLAHDRSYLRFSDFVSLGHDEPPIKFTYLANEQQTKTANITTGLTGINFTATGTFAYAKMDSATTQAAEDTPAPRWVVKSEPTDENWNSAIMSYSALNMKIYRWPQSTLPMADIFHDTELDAKYGMSVEVSMPIQKNTPKVSLVYRHQTHCWVAVKSKAICRGIILVAANYIPDICTERSLWIQEYPSLNLVHNHSGGNLPEGDMSPKSEQTSDGIFSFATATTSEMSTRAGEHSWSSRHLKIWRRPKKPREQDIPIYTHVYRGWDHTNLRWQKVIWPKLDSKLQPSQGESAVAWKLDWQGGGEMEDVIMEAQTQGSSTGPRAESSFAVKEQADESEFLGMSVKPDKDKARAIA